MKLKKYIIIWVLTLLCLYPRMFAYAQSYDVLGHLPIPSSEVARIASAPNGNLYVSDNFSGSVHAISSNGVPLYDINIGRPLGLTVDTAGNIYIGNNADGSVSVYNPAGQYVYSLGIGAGAFLTPSDIAVHEQPGSRLVYITDSKANVVRCYQVLDSETGTLRGTLAYSATAPTYFKFPTGVAVDQSTNKVYVTWLYERSSSLGVVNYGAIISYNLSLGGPVQFVDFNKKITSPQGLAVDSTYIYVSDAFQSSVAVFNKSWVFIGYMGEYGEGDGLATNVAQLRTPLDISFDKNNRLFITNSYNQRVEILGVGNYNDFTLSPMEVTFSLEVGGVPASAPLSLLANISTDWTADVPAPSWVSLSTAAGTAPQDISVTADPAGLPVGFYTEYITFTSSNGIELVLKVNLEVKEVALALDVVPGSLHMNYNQSSTTYPLETLTVMSNGGALDWNASASVPWITLEQTSGTTPSSVDVTLNSLAEVLSPWTYNVTITFTAVGVSPVVIPVTLDVIYAGTVEVTSNISGASFDISGPQTYSGTGTYWSEDNVQPGTYTISFGYVPGYLKPATRTFTVETGDVITIDGTYIPNMVTGLLAAADNVLKTQVYRFDNDGYLQGILNLPPPGFKLIDMDSYNVGGDQFDEILLAMNFDSLPGTQVRGYTRNGSPINGLNFVPFASSNSDLSVGDADGDRLPEIAAAATGQGVIPTVKIYTYNGNPVSYSGLQFQAYLGSSNGALIKFADVYGNGSEELVAIPSFDGGSLDVSIWKIFDNGGTLAAQRTFNFMIDTGVVSYKTKSGNYRPALTSGDFDGDGIYEIVVAYGDKSQQGVYNVDIYSSDGSLLNNFGVAVSGAISIDCGDTDGDGVDELVIGDGNSYNNTGMIRIFEGDGTPTGVAFKGFVGNGGILNLGNFGGSN